MVGRQRQRIRRIVRSADERRSDVITPGLAFPEFMMRVPINRTRAGEETNAAAHVGTEYGSRSTGRPIEVMYSPKRDVYSIINGHHRVAEAKAQGQSTIPAKVSIFNERKGFGALTERDLQEMY